MNNKEFKYYLEEVLKDSEVMKNEECFKLISNAERQLDAREEGDIIAAKLSDRISYYLISHSYKAPKKILALSKNILSAPAKQRGLISVPFWLSNLFR